MAMTIKDLVGEYAELKQEAYDNPRRTDKQLPAIDILEQILEIADKKGALKPENRKKHLAPLVQQLAHLR